MAAALGSMQYVVHQVTRLEMTRADEAMPYNMAIMFASQHEQSCHRASQSMP